MDNIQGTHTHVHFCIFGFGCTRIFFSHAQCASCIQLVNFHDTFGAEEFINIMLSTGSMIFTILLQYPRIDAVFYGKGAKLFKLHRNQGFRLPMSDVTIQFRITSRVVELFKVP